MTFWAIWLLAISMAWWSGWIAGNAHGRRALATKLLNLKPPREAK